jgi:hypothetical protein
MISVTVVLLLLIGVPALLRFFGFAEPVAAILGALAALCLVMPLELTQLATVLDFGRLGSENLIILVAAMIASLLAGCHAAPRPDRPLGWYAAGDAGFIGALLAAVVLSAYAFEVAVSSVMFAALVIGTALWLAMAGAGALIGPRSSAPPPVAPTSHRLGIGIFAIVLISCLSIPAILLGIMTPSEAFTFFGLPTALVFRLVAGMTQGRRLAGYGTDVLRGIADGAWIVLVAYAARAAWFALKFAGLGSEASLALSPMWLMPLFAIAVLVLGIVVGPTYGALLAVAISAPVLTAAGVPQDACALVAALMLTLGYAMPSVSLLSPRGPLARPASPAALAAMAVGVVIVVGVSAAITTMHASG